MASKLIKFAENGSSTAQAGQASRSDASVLPASGFLTADWVKRRYSISNSTLYKWIGENRFPRAVHIGPRAVRWRAEDLVAFEARLQAAG